MKKSILSAIFLVFISIATFAADSDKIFKLFTSKENEEWIATAFVISDHKLLTAAHTFAKGGMNHFIIVGDERISVKIIKIDYHEDIAILESKLDFKEVFELSAEKPNKGDRLRIVGYPYECRELHTIESTVKSPGDTGKSLKTSPNSMEGMSGCPAIGSDGKVYGMLVQGWNGTSKSVTAKTLTEFTKK